jgi:hypothetical protein
VRRRVSFLSLPTTLFSLPSFLSTIST